MLVKQLAYKHHHHHHHHHHHYLHEMATKAHTHYTHTRIQVESRRMFPESRRMFPESRRMFPESRRMFPESRLTSSTASSPIPSSLACCTDRLVNQRENAFRRWIRIIMIIIRIRIRIRGVVGRLHIPNKPR
jgi:hypothetical protein